MISHTIPTLLLTVLPPLSFPALSSLQLSFASCACSSIFVSSLLPGGGCWSLRCEETSAKYKGTQMDALPFIIERLSEKSFQNFLSKHAPRYLVNLEFAVQELVKVQRYMRWSDFNKHPEDQKQALIKGVRLTVRKVGKFMRTIHEHDTQEDNGSQNAVPDLLKEWGHVLNVIAGVVYCCYKLKDNKAQQEIALEEVYGENCEEIERIGNSFNSLDDPGTSNQHVINSTRLNEQQSLQLFLLKAFPVLIEYSEPSKRKAFLRELSKELDNLPQLICEACHGIPLALVLVGSLLSLKEKINDIWNGVRNDLYKFKDHDDRLLDIINYCYEDLPYFLKPCFLYLTCYPKDHMISARTLINIWIAEGFISTEGEGRTVEEAAYKYLEQLVKRSLVDVSERSFLSTIKYCRVRRVIHQFAINKSNKEGFLAANPDVSTIESLFRVAIHSDNNCHYGELEINHMHSFLAFNSDQNILRNAIFLRVLELSKSTVTSTTIPKMTCIRYLGLRFTSIDTLPENIEVMQNLQTLDVRNTNLKALPESLWNIPELRHVYVVSSPEIKGPPPTANISDLQTLKTVAAPKSWLDKCPQFLISLRKLALTNPDCLDWNSVSNLLSLSANLVSLTIIGESVPSEFADTRAFPKLESVKSIRLEGIWKCRNLFIDNVKFPPNLTKLTLSKSGLKEDPMPRLEKIKTLKFLRLQDEAYTGKQMVCSEKRFPCLQFFELLKLKRLEKLVVISMAMPELKTLRIDQCEKLSGDIPNLGHATIERS